MIVPSAPEPFCDLAAQVEAVLDKHNPKDCVFIARSNERDIPPKAWEIPYLVLRNEGMLATVNPEKASEFLVADDGGMARILDYPERKTDALRSGSPVVARVIDDGGRVIIEAVVSSSRVDIAEAHFGKYILSGCKFEVVDPIAMIERRFRLRKEGSLRSVA